MGNLTGVWGIGFGFGLGEKEEDGFFWGLNFQLSLVDFSRKCFCYAYRKRNKNGGNQDGVPKPKIFFSLFFLFFPRRGEEWRKGYLMKGIGGGKGVELKVEKIFLGERKGDMWRFEKRGGKGIGGICGGIRKKKEIEGLGVF